MSKKLKLREPNISSIYELMLYRSYTNDARIRIPYIKYVDVTLVQWRRNFHYGKSMTISVLNRRWASLDCNARLEEEALYQE